jgi:hypothetical protein
MRKKVGTQKSTAQSPNGTVRTAALKARTGDTGLSGLTAEDFQRILKITKVSDNFEFVRLGIDIQVHLMANFTRKTINPRRSKLVDATYDHLAKLSAELWHAIDNAVTKLGNDITLDFEATSLGERDEDLAVGDFISTVGEFGDHCKEMSKLRTKDRPASRPRGSFQHPHLRTFVHHFYNDVVVYGGGELTVWEDNGVLKGTLPLVLDVLRERIPGTVPRNLSYATLRRWISDAAQLGNAPSKKD